MDKISNIKLIITIASIAILISFLLPLLNYEIESDRGRYIHQDNLKMIWNSLKQYSMDYDDFLPPFNGSKGLDLLRDNAYLTDLRLFYGPVDRINSSENIEENLCIYTYFAGHKFDDPPNTPICTSKFKKQNEFVCVLYLDGTIEKYKKIKNKKLRSNQN